MSAVTPPVHESPVDCDLLVVGLGPTGDVLAGLTAQLGLKVVAIDRAAGVHPLPRAAVFDHEIMRIFQMLGVADRILPHTRAPQGYQFVTADGQILLDFANLALTSSGWAQTYALHQPAVETALRARLAELSADVRASTTLRAATQTPDHVVAAIEGPEGSSVLHARYMVACDGASSGVREALGVELHDYGFDEPWLVIDAVVDDPGDLPIVCRQICDPRRPTTYMAMSGRRFRWEFMLKPGETPEALLADEAIAALIAPWNCLERLRIERKAVYRFHGLVARDWRRGRILLAGDAAHQMPPFAGQGMCSGVRDAANLAWKLAAVVRGEDPALLDTYQVEREPHVRAIIETAIAMGKVVCILDEAAAAARDTAMLARRARGEQDVSVAYPALKGGKLMATPLAGELFPQPVIDGRRLDDLIGLDGVLIGRNLPETPAGLRRLDLDEGQAGAFEPALSAWLSAARAPAVLVRPDRHVFGVGEAEALLGTWSSNRPASVAA